MDSHSITAQDVLSYWFGEAPFSAKKFWFRKSEETDAAIIAEFADLVREAAAGGLTRWRDSAEGSLALVVLLDQLTRNIHRGQPEAYANDPLARQVALEAIDRGLDRELPPLQRAFLYMPLMHSEDAALHERSVALFESLAAAAPPELVATCKSFLDYAHKHKAVIDRFGRYPHRNAVLGRASSPEEEAYVREHGGF